MSDSRPMLQMRSITKTFGTAKALSGVDLDAYAGEVHALMGENGAGKSTLMKILSGAYTADPGGSVLIDGQPVTLGSPLKAKAHGIAVIYQELSLSPNLTVAENMFLGAEPSRFGVTDRSRMRKLAEPILKQLGIGFDATARVADLSLGERQMVEIARALTTKARIIVMDEPTTSLTSRETERLFDVIDRLKADGIAIVYISHRMEEIYKLSDRVSVLRDGAYVGTLMRDELTASILVSMMVGRDLSTFYKKEHRNSDAGGRAVLEVKDIGDGRRVHHCSFDVKTSGEVKLDGKALAVATPREALDAGIAYLTEDRKALGLFLDMSISDNINIGVMGKDSKSAGVRDFGRARERALRAIESLSIRTTGANINVGALSGGNQQKALLARLLETKPRVVMLDEPTRGVDVGAKSEIYRIIDELAQDGIAIVVISSDLPEILGISDRVLVMREGRIVGEVGGATGVAIEQETIMKLATGTAGAAA
jgi:ribose transport system ATP-binding protein